MKTIRNVIKKVSLLMLLMCSLAACKPTEEKPPTIDPPTITLGEIVIDVKTSTVRITGTIQGNSEIIKSFGFEYGLAEDLAGATQVTAAIDKGSFTVEIPNLQLNTKYFYRGYVTYTLDGEKTLYTDIRSFELEMSTPTLTTTPITSITEIGAASGGNITSDGGANVTRRGVVWSTNENPEIDLTTKTEDGEGTGEFTSTISNLTVSTTYYVRAYATNSEGTAYGNEITFATKDKAEQKAALVALFEATGGASWTNKTNWGSDDSPISAWHGVTLENGYVTKIELANNNLTGAILDGIGSFNELLILDVSSNNLTSLNIRKIKKLQELRCGSQKENKTLTLYLTEAQAKTWNDTWNGYSEQVNSRVNLALEGTGENEDSTRDDEYNW